MVIGPSQVLSPRLGFGQIEGLGLITAVTPNLTVLGHRNYSAVHNIGTGWFIILQEVRVWRKQT